MPINVGDAVLTFVGDTTQLDQAFAKIGPEAEQAMAPATEAAAGMGEALGAAGNQAEQAAAKIVTGWARVAEATVANRAAQQELALALKGVTDAMTPEGMTALAAAQEKAAEAAHNLAVAQKEVAASAKTITVAEKEAGEAALVFGAQAQEAGEMAAFSMAEAKGTMALAGEELGVKIPRHLRTFIAELPGVGAAMEAAFSAVAVFVLIDVLVQATKKLTEFVSNTLIYTEAMKEEYAAQVQLNQALVTHAEKMAELKKAYDYLGLEGVAKTRKEITDLSDSITKNEAKWNANELAAAGYRAELQKLEIELEKTANDQAMLAGEPGLASDGPQKRIEELKAQIQALGNANTKLNADLGEQRQQQLNKNKELNAQELADRIKSGEATVAAEKTVADARLDVVIAESRLRLTSQKVAYLEEASITASGAEAKYQIELQSLRRVAALLALDPTKNAERIKENNAKIQALESEHEAKLLTSITSFRDKVNEVVRHIGIFKASEAGPALIDQIIPTSGDLNIRLEQFKAVMASVGITGSATWLEVRDAAQLAFDQMKRSGLATYTDLLQAQMKVLNAEISYRKATAQPYSQQDANLKAITKEYNSLTGVVDNLGKHWNSAQRSLDQFSLKMHQQRGELEGYQKTMDGVIADMSQAFGSAIQQWVMGQESLGIALRKGLAEYLAVLAGKAAMDALYFLAWGIADSFWDPPRAGADFAAAAEFGALAVAAGAAAYGINPRSNSGGGSSTTAQQGPTPTGQAATGGPTGPTTGVNVQHFAKGGLVMSPTLAVIGDAINGAASSGAGQREAAIPLDDPEATGAIADAIGGRGGTTNHYHIQGVISSDMMDKVIDKINERTGSGKVLIATKARRVEKK